MEGGIGESRMENYLIEQGYEVYDSEKCIDSTIVSDIAIDLGYKVHTSDSGENIFFK